LSKPKHRGYLPAQIREKALHAACTVLEISNSMESDPGIIPWAWFYCSYNQYHAAAIILGELLSNPETVFQERAWKALDDRFKLRGTPTQNWAQGNIETDDWRLCRALYEKALSTRKWPKQEPLPQPMPGVTLEPDISYKAELEPLQAEWRPNMDWATWDHMMTTALFDDNILSSPTFQELANYYSQML